MKKKKTNFIANTMKAERKLATTMVDPKTLRLTLPLLLLGLFTIGCPEPIPTTYTVTLDANGGINGTTTTISVAHGKPVLTTITGLPTRDGYTLAGWNTAKDETGTDFVFGTTPVTANITIYAKWNTATYTITFNSNDGSAVASIIVAHGSKATAPAPPTRDGYIFVGWYKEAAFTNAFVFENEVITSNITIYAKWTGVPRTITFNSNNGSAVANIIVAHGSKATAPAPPTRDGYIFVGWYKEAAFTNAFVFENEVITANIMLYAKWDQTAVINGKTYKIVTIGTQTWMAENLNDVGNTSGTSSCYDDNAANCTTYGRLYDWQAAMSIDTVIKGWRLPSDAEWTTLSNYLGGESKAGGKMKVEGGSGFDAQLAGNYLGYFGSLGSYGNFWSSSAYSDSTAWYRYIHMPSANLYRGGSPKGYRYSVRLLKD